MKATNYCVRFGHSLWSVNQFASAKRGKTNNKFIASQSFLSSDTDGFKKKATNLLYTVWSLVMVRNQLTSATDIVPASSKEKESDELLYTVLVTRYGPQSNNDTNPFRHRIPKHSATEFMAGPDAYGCMYL
ncbi:hypothetical protein E2986_13627 [Frieseomelitta varia]|uniref:Uncharacterized protein n=1 Tax=Frieseomelitta varia TaxID=561572 RepID=A0A833VXW2_9HYME|nr:hypothetical protein E2986_13627 [Frieseomelitta varia]